MKPYELSDRDRMENQLIATGALFGVLHEASGSNEMLQQVEVVTEEDVATNQLRVRFLFLKSRYRITVEMEPQ